MPEIRAAVHVHSTWSFDGVWDLPRIMRTLRRCGYDAALTAEHSQSMDEGSWEGYRRLCADLSTADFLVVPGMEYRDASNVVHVPAWGDLPHLGDGRDIGSLLEEVSENGGAAVLAHPARHDAFDSVDPGWGRHLVGVEAWNRKYDGWRPSRTAVELAAAWRVGTVASLDFHRRRQLHPLATVLDVDGRPSPASVVAALRAGRFHATFLGTPLEAWTVGRRATLLDHADTARQRAAAMARGFHA